MNDLAELVMNVLFNVAETYKAKPLQKQFGFPHFIYHFKEASEEILEISKRTLINYITNPSQIEYATQLLTEACHKNAHHEMQQSMEHYLKVTNSLN